MSSYIHAVYESIKKSWALLSYIPFNFWDIAISSFIQNLPWYPSTCLVLVYYSNFVHSGRMSNWISTCFQLWFTFDFFFLGHFNTFRKSIYLVIFSEDTPQYSYMWGSKQYPSIIPNCLNHIESLLIYYPVTLHTSSTLRCIFEHSRKKFYVERFLYICYMYNPYMNNTSEIYLSHFSIWQPSSRTSILSNIHHCKYVAILSSKAFIFIATYVSCCALIHHSTIWKVCNHLSALWFQD